MKKFAILVASTAIIASMSASSIQAADGKKTEAAAAIVGVVALGLLGAAVADSQHNSGNVEYRHHPHLHPDENAVGACMHHTKHLVKKEGGHKAKLDKVDKVEAKSHGETLVVFRATGYFDFGHKTSKIRCTVKHHKVVKFEFT
tara:strand:- start:142 stop:573 length:432 start_codon:yes stop_codon:yes gene_type:complete